MTIPQEMFRTENGTPVWVSGAGPTVILVHGVLVDHRMWTPQVAALSPRHRVCCMDMLGHGDAPDPPGDRVLDDFVTQVDEVIRQFSGDGKPVLGGFSMGGLVSQAYAVRHHARLSGLILLNAVHDRSPEQARTVRERYEANLADGVDNAVRSGAQRWFKPRDYESHAAEIEDNLNLIRDGDFAAKCKAHRVFATSDAEVTGKLGVISCPVLVMTGEEDTGSTPEMSCKMAGAIPNAELQILDGQHHLMPMLDADRVNGILLDFLSRCQSI